MVIHYIFLFLSMLAFLWLDYVSYLLVISLIGVELLRGTVKKAGNLDLDHYRGFSAVLSGNSNVIFLITLITFTAIPVFSFITGLNSPVWSEYGSISYALCLASIAGAVWTFGFSPKNFFLDSWLFIDRVILVGLGAMVFYNPIFLPLFVLILRVHVNQFKHPEFVPFTKTHLSLPYSLLITLSGLTCVNLLFELQKNTIFLLVFSCYATQYYQSGLRKLTAGWKNGVWLMKNKIKYLFLNATVFGWPPFISKQHYENIAGFLDVSNTFILWFTFVAEFFALIMLVSWEFAIFLSIMQFCMHTGIFICSGINFWKWQLVNLGLLFGLLISPVDETGMFGQLELILPSIVLIVSSKTWMKPMKLGWIDTPFMNYYRLFGITEDGEKIELSPYVFMPFDRNFSQGVQGRFGKLFERPTLVDCLGNCGDSEISEMLYRLKSDELEIDEMVQKYGERRYEQSAWNHFEELVKDRFQNNRHRTVSRFLAIPFEFYTHLSGKNDLDREYQEFIIERYDMVWLNNSQKIEQKGEQKCIDITS